jgi:hypothetical protein
MAISFEVLESEVLNLHASQRSLLLERLVSSLDHDAAWEAGWEKEADRREAAIVAGKAQWIEGIEFIAQIRAQLT